MPKRIIVWAQQLLKNHDMERAAFWLLAFLLLLPPSHLHALTLSEAVQQALRVSLPLKEQRKAIERSRLSYLSTVDPYLPRLSIELNYERNLGSLSPVFRTSRSLFDLSLSLSLRLFDGGERYALRRQALLLSEKELDNLSSLQQDLIYTTKVAFFETMMKGMVVKAREEAYGAAKKIHELTRERYMEGVAKRIEVLQSQVRVSEAEIDLFSAEQEYEKARENLKSLLQGEVGELEGPEGEPTFFPQKEEVIAHGLSRRPDIRRQEKELERLRFAYKEKRAKFYPKFDVALSEQRQGREFLPQESSRVLFLGVSFPLFDGVGRYYDLLRLKAEIDGAGMKLDELKRVAALEITKALLDLELARENVKRAKALLSEAEANFAQALEEYRVGKGDILTLLQSQKAVAEAKERVLGAILSSRLSLAYLEKVACMEGQE